jgi:hypothetical protein
VEKAFFEPLGSGQFRATAATAGPWSESSQHGGPPSALAAREMQLHEPDEGMRLARVCVDILRPVPVGLVTVRTRTLRPGKRVALLETVVTAADQEVLVARGWSIALTGDLPVIAPESDPVDIPEAARMPEFPGGYMDGYLAAIDWRFVSGNFRQPGPGQAWGRPRIPLLPGEELTPMSRALLLADSGSGISMAVDARKLPAINVDLTVVLRRDTAGDWLLLDSVTTMGGQGTGVAETRLSDRQGIAGTALQTLLVRPA